MANIDIIEEWHELRIRLAASDDRLRNVALWLLEQEGDYDESEAKFKNMARSACRLYGLNLDEDLISVLGLCEQQLVEEQLYD